MLLPVVVVVAVVRSLFSIRTPFPSNPSRPPLLLCFLWSAWQLRHQLNQLLWGGLSLWQLSMASNLSSKHQSLWDRTAWVPIIGSSPIPPPENTWGAATFRSKCPSSALKGGQVSGIRNSYSCGRFPLKWRCSCCCPPFRFHHYLPSPPFFFVMRKMQISVPTSKKLHAKFISGFTGESPVNHRFPLSLVFFFRASHSLMQHTE